MTTEAAATAAPVAAPATAAQTDPNATAAPGAETTPEQSQPEKTFSQKDLDDILEKRLAKERRKREEQKRETEYWRRTALDKGEQPPERSAQPAQQPAGDGEPKRQDYDSYEAYIDARAEWRADRRVEERLTKQRDEEAQTRTAAEQQKLEQTFRDHAQKVMTEIEDFEDVISGSPVMLTKGMADSMLHAGEIGPRILYHLAKNPAEAQRIAALPESRQAAEIGKIEVKLSGPAQEMKKPSKAPEPINPIGGKAPATDGEPDPNSNGGADWRAWRERQVRAKRKG